MKKLFHDAVYVSGHISGPRIMLYLLYLLIVIATVFVFITSEESRMAIIEIWETMFAATIGYCFATKGFGLGRSYIYKRNAAINPTEPQTPNDFDQGGSNVSG